MIKKAVDIKLKNILTELFNLAEMNMFYLAGGTNLALKYNHRISTDLDFFCDNLYEINLELDVLPALLSYFGKERLSIIAINKNTLRTNIDGVKVDFMKWLQVKEILESTQILGNTNWKLASDIDVAAMKMSAIVNRGNKKDFFDMALLIQLFSLEKIINAYKMKYQIESDNDVIKYLADFYEADLESNVAIQTIDFGIEDWETIKENIKDHLNNYIKKDIKFNT